MIIKMTINMPLVNRKRQASGAVTTRPTIRDYYDEETKSFFENRRKLYPPASSRT